MRILLCHGRHHGGVLQNHRGVVHRDVRGDEAVPIRILPGENRTAKRRAGGPTDGERLRNDHVLVVVANRKREEHLRGRAPVVVAGENNEELLRGRALVAVAGEKKEEQLRGRALVVAENVRVDHRRWARQEEWEGCPIRLARISHGTLVQRR